MLAEAGTGTGKTLGYVAPASLWAERNGGSVWLSTFTRHLQRQIDAELTRLFPDPAERRRRVVVRKGRENYLCLLNLQEQVGAPLGGGTDRRSGWSRAGRWRPSDGDVAGGDLPGWFTELFGPGLLPAIADRRGECIHGACPHYKTCFVEHTIRRARTAELVVANHALVMTQAAWGGLDDNQVPSRYVFDEGHHVFDAADGAFAAELSGVGRARSCAAGCSARKAGGRERAGLRRRLDDLLGGSRRTRSRRSRRRLQAARVLPSAWAGPRGCWRAEPGDAGAVRGLPAARARSGARAVAAGDPDSGSAECDLHPVAPGLRRGRGGARAGAALASRSRLRTLVDRLGALLEDEAAALETQQRQRIEAARRSIQRRALLRLEAWPACCAPWATGRRSRDVTRTRSIHCGSNGAAARTGMPGCIGTGSTRRFRSPRRWRARRTDC